MGKNYRQWRHTEHVLRTGETTITIVGIRMNTIIECENSQECLTKFLSLRKEYEDAFRFAGPEVYKDGTRL